MKKEEIVNIIETCLQRAGFQYCSVAHDPYEDANFCFEEDYFTVDDVKTPWKAEDFASIKYKKRDAKGEGYLRFIFKNGGFLYGENTCMNNLWVEMKGIKRYYNDLSHASDILSVLYRYGFDWINEEEHEFVIEDGRLLLYNGYPDTTDIVIPDGVTRIGRRAFYGIDVRTVTCPEGIEEIEKEAFGRCRSLEQINIPPSVRKIGIGAFRSCEVLNHIAIPDAVDRLRDGIIPYQRDRRCGVFEFCKALQDVTMKQVKERSDEMTFYGTPFGETLK